MIHPCSWGGSWGTMRWSNSVKAVHLRGERRWHSPACAADSCSAVALLVDSSGGRCVIQEFPQLFHRCGVNWGALCAVCLPPSTTDSPETHSICIPQLIRKVLANEIHAFKTWIGTYFSNTVLSPPQLPLSRFIISFIFQISSDPFHNIFFYDSVYCPSSSLIFIFHLKKKHTKYSKSYLALSSIVFLQMQELKLSPASCSSSPVQRRKAGWRHLLRQRKCVSGGDFPRRREEGCQHVNIH